MTGLRRARLPTWPTIAVASLVAPLLACTCVCVWVPPQMQCAGSALAILTSQLAALRSLTTQRWDKGPIPVPARRRGTFAGPVVHPTVPVVLCCESARARAGRDCVSPIGVTVKCKCDWLCGSPGHSLTLWWVTARDIRLSALYRSDLCPSH